MGLCLSPSLTMKRAVKASFLFSACAGLDLSICGRSIGHYKRTGRKIHSETRIEGIASLYVLILHH